MCIICVLWEKGKLTKKEADNAFVELIDTSNMTEEELMHAQEAIEKISHS